MFAKEKNDIGAKAIERLPVSAVSAQSTAVTEASSVRRVIYLANTFFLIFLSFFAGYNFKAYQVRESLDQRMSAYNQYMDEIRKNHETSEELVRKMSVSAHTHYETKIQPLPVEPETVKPSSTLSEKRPAPAPATVPEMAFSVETPAPVIAEPTQPPPAPAKTVKRPVLHPAPTVPFRHVRHRIQDGEVLSGLVPRRYMSVFLTENPAIADPDRIYPGQDILLRIPLQNISRGTYMNRYFIRPCEPAGPDCSFMLASWLTIPEGRTVIGFLIHENPTRITSSTVPFIDLTAQANHLKDGLWQSSQGQKNGLHRVHRINGAHGPMLFRTDRLDLSNQPAHYRGVRADRFSDLAGHNQAIIKDLSRLYSGILQGKPGQGMYHYLIYGGTVVQSAFLGERHFEDSPDKQRILIGVVHTGPETKNALSTLKHALGICRVSRGSMVEVTPKTLKHFYN